MVFLHTSSKSPLWFKVGGLVKVESLSPLVPSRVEIRSHETAKKAETALLQILIRALRGRDSLARQRPRQRPPRHHLLHEPALFVRERTYLARFQPRCAQPQLADALAMEATKPKAPDRAHHALDFWSTRYG